MGELGVGVLEKEGFLSKLLGLQPDPWEAGTDLWRGWGGLGGPPGRGRLGSDREKDVPLPVVVEAVTL